jgi:hypothetical protein
VDQYRDLMGFWAMCVQFMGDGGAKARLARGECVFC